MKKYIAVAVLLLLISVNVIPSTSTIVEKKSIILTFNEGSLSGFVNDTSMNSIEGARVRVCFHGTYEEDYSDSSGYYHVTNIPICNCTKNCTAFKQGYKPECVWLSIYENTIYDFVLTPGKTLYVGGSGEGNYTRIQEGLDNASNGDTVFVFSGWYDVDKWIYINKSIRLIGEDKENTVIYSSGIDVVVSEVKVSGFTILNGSGITINSYSSEVANNNTIFDNIFISNESLYGVGGITILNSSYNTVSNNSFFSCGLLMEMFDISDVANSCHNLIYNNKVNNKPLVYFEDTSDKIIDDAGQVILIGCNNVTVESLELSNTIIGVQILDSINCSVLGNVFSNNYLGGIALENSNNNTILSNIILNGGLGAMLCISGYNLISGNSFENNEINLLFFNSSCNHISYNNIRFGFSYALRRLKSILSIDSDNKWIGNFWNRPRLLPVLIWGFKTNSFTWFTKWYSFDVDWRPALKPYDI